MSERTTHPAPPYDDRRRRLREVLAERGLEAALITDLVNLRYLTGFSGSNGALLLPVDGDPLFATDGRYIEQGEAETGFDPRLVKGPLAPKLPVLAGELGIRRVAVETHHLTVDQHDALRETGAEHGLEFAKLEQAVEELRMVKDESEVAALREACEVSTEAVERPVPGRIVGRTER